MKSLRIEAPAFQNWSCHGCTECCRGKMFIEVTAEEKERIEKQGWSKADGVDPATMIVAQGGTYRLGHREDGACVFLEGAKCRIHSRFGEAAKPRACRLFPLVFHPAGEKVMAGLRFSCPSAVANTGPRLSEQGAELRKLAALVVPEDVSEIPAPRILKSASLPWPDFARFIERLDWMISGDRPMALKLHGALRFLGLVEQAQFDHVTGGEAEEILNALCGSALSQLQEHPGKPSGLGWMLFRSHLFTYMRKDTVADLSATMAQRLGLLVRMTRFVAGSDVTIAGELPVKWIETLGSFGGVPAGGEAMLTRFFRYKVQTLHFCGLAYYGMSLVEGFRNLALLYPVILWLARRHAVAEKRRNIRVEDVAWGIKTADHHHGFSPALGRAPARRCVGILAQRGEIEKLAAVLSI